MDIPIELFLGFIGTSIALAIFGFVRNPQIPATLVFGGLFILTVSISTENIIMSYGNSVNNPDTTIYNVISFTSTPLINAVTGEIIAEYPANSASELLDKEIDCISIPLAKMGSPNVAVPIQVGIFDSTGTLVRQFGNNLNITNVLTTLAYFDFCLPTGETYTIGSLPSLQERIGVKYNASDAVNSLVGRADNNDPFDGTNTVFQRYTTSWASTVTQDLTMILTLRGEDISQVENTYEFTELPKTLFGLIGVIFMLAGALMVAKN